MKEFLFIIVLLIVKKEIFLFWSDRPNSNLTMKLSKLNLSTGLWERQTFAGEAPDYRYGATGIYLTEYPKSKQI